MEKWSDSDLINPFSTSFRASNVVSYLQCRLNGPWTTRQNLATYIQNRKPQQNVTGKETGTTYN